MRKAFILFVLSLTMFAPVCSAETTAIFGFPSYKVESSCENCEGSGLDKRQSAGLALRIIRDQAGRYYWSSRGNKSLRYSTSGNYEYYVADTGYIKIDSVTGEYMEHVSLGLYASTFFGLCARVEK